jgi:hypothetical protein
MHQHQADAERGEQVAVVGEALRALAGGDLAAEADDEGTAAEGVDVGRGPRTQATNWAVASSTRDGR